MSGATSDLLDRAIAAAETQRVQAFQLKLQTGRLAAVQVPVDATDTELLEIIATIAHPIREAVMANRLQVARPSLLVPVR